MEGCGEERQKEEVRQKEGKVRNREDELGRWNKRNRKSMTKKRGERKSW